MDIKIVICKLCMLMLIMVFGYVLRKKNVITDEQNKGFSSLIVNVTLPCLLISSMLTSKSTATTSQILSIVSIGTVIYFVLTIIAMFVPKVFGANKSEDGVYRFCTILNNNVFMGFPIIQSILGSKAIFFAAILNIPSTLFMFSIGVYYMTRHVSNGGFSIKKALNPASVTSIICVALYFAHFTLSGILADTATAAGSMTVPLSMIVLGASLATIPTKEVIKDIKIYFFCLIKMVAIPLATFLALAHLYIDKTILYVIIITLAMPGPTLCVSLALDCGADLKLSSKYVFVSTVISVVTIPFVISCIL